MNKATYHAIFISTSNSGCVATFATSAQDEIFFPVQIEMECWLCSKAHGFKYDRYYIVGTPKESIKFAEFCEIMHIKQDINVT